MGRTLNLSAFIIFLGLFLQSCSEPEFSARRGSLTQNNPTVVRTQTSACSNFTLVRPKVDLLFLWDNSSSTFFIDPQVRQALNRLVDNVSNRFDYHIVLAPLIRRSGRPVNDEMRIVTHDTVGLNSQALSLRVSREDASSYLSFSTASGSSESGLERARELLHQNQSNGIFRQGAYTLIVLMSTGNDNSYETGSGFGGGSALRDPYINNKVHELLCLRGHYDHSYGAGYDGGIYGSNCSGAPSLDSSMMRFISIVANNENRCTQNNINNVRVGVTYEMTSNKIYLEPYNNGTPSPNDQFGAASQQRGNISYNLYDSTDICRGDYSGVFDGVNSAITDTVINHIYKRWPVDVASASVDPDTIVVKKGNGQEFFEIPSGVTIVEDLDGKDDRDTSNQPVHGWRYLGTQTNQPTRFFPSPGEPYTGHMIQLYGDAKVTYPECLQVNYFSPVEYYGYVHIASKPLESSIQLRVAGTTVPRCQNSTSSNCWELEKTSGQPWYQENKNIKIQGPNNYTPAEPAELKTGYFLRLRGNAIIPSGTEFSVNWLPSS